MRRWLRTDKTIMMELSVPLLQVNFFEDHTKLVVSQESPNKGYLITYIDTSRRTSSYWLNDIRDFGCTSDLYERLYYVYKVSREFAEMHNNTIAWPAKIRRKMHYSLNDWNLFYRIYVCSVSCTRFTCNFRFFFSLLKII